MQELVRYLNHLNRSFDSLDYQKRAGILFLICALGFIVMFPSGELTLLTLVFVAASATYIISTATPDQMPSEPEADGADADPVPPSAQDNTV